MIKFFRKIRQKLLTENKFSKYLLYAIGEILLVVIGILIALSINNWNESRKKENLKQRLYVELRESIMSDTVAYNNAIKRYTSAYLNSQLLKEAIATDASYTSDLDSSFAKIQGVQSNEANYIIWRRISDVGIEIIDDTDLKNEVIHYYEDSKNFVRFGSTARGLLEKIYPKYFIKHDLFVSATPVDFELLKTANDFNIVLDYCEKSSKTLIERTIHRKSLAKNILTILENEITLSKDKLVNTPYKRTMRNDSLSID